MVLLYYHPHQCNNDRCFESTHVFQHSSACAIYYPYWMLPHHVQYLIHYLYIDHLKFQNMYLNQMNIRLLYHRFHLQHVHRYFPKKNIIHYLVVYQHQRCGLPILDQKVILNQLFDTLIDSLQDFQ